MKKSLLFILLLAIISGATMAEEGMWVPMLIEKLNIKQMQDLGLNLTAEDIYNVNHSSLKDAIVQFGGGCTGSIVSPDGLILTNHHCGYGSIQRHSTLEHDYLTNGFWAGSREEELPNPGLTVTLLVRMEDVTDAVLKGINESTNQLQRNALVKKNSESIEKEAVKGTWYQAKVRSFFYGNRYYLMVTEVFKDVRLVGAPPSAIGQFGGDTDNWMWPRHGGDFSIFRIYADSNNRPAEYSKSNVPYHPKNFLSISLKGYHEGDFTFVFGYPGGTREYLTSYGVELIAEKENPVRIRLREERLEIFNSAMEQDRLIRIQYSSKHAGIANGWKKMTGETKGIRVTNAIQKKRDFEKRFLESDPGNQALLENFRNTYNGMEPVDMASVYLSEAGMGIELVRFASNFRNLVNASEKDTTTIVFINKMTGNLIKNARGFFKDYNSSVDKRVMGIMLKEMALNMDPRYMPDIINRTGIEHQNDFTESSAGVFSATLFADSSRLIKFLDHYKKSDHKKIERDPAYMLMMGIYDRYEKEITPQITKFTGVIDSLQRIYMKAQMNFQKEKNFYPDANSTLRISYGTIKDLSPADGVSYNYFTTGQGILEKEDSTIYDYAVAPRLKELLQKKDWGRYADKDGSLHIAFIAGNHTSGGMSGSPVLDRDGRLIGLNFDRNWEGTMSDLMYDPDRCRNITVDIRYCLFLVDKFAGAGYLLKEMKISE